MKDNFCITNEYSIIRKGSFTIETACVMPLVLMPWVNAMLRSVVSCWRLIQLTGKLTEGQLVLSEMLRWLAWLTLS